MSIKKISVEEAEEIFSASTTKGKWSDLLGQISKDGEPRTVGDLTRGQVAALYRASKAKGFRVKTHYPTIEDGEKSGSVLIAP